jgi:hypothetical protein
MGLRLMLVALLGLVAAAEVPPDFSLPEDPVVAVMRELAATIEGADHDAPITVAHVDVIYQNGEPLRGVTTSTGTIQIRAGEDEARTLLTLIHEVAHAMTIDEWAHDHHGETWCELYRSGVMELAADHLKWASHQGCLIRWIS